MLRWLAADELDAAFCLLAGEIPDELAAERLSDEEVVAAFAPGRAPPGPHVAVADLARHRIVAPRRGSAITTALERRFAEAGQPLRLALESGDPFLLRSLAARGFATAILPRSLTALEDPPSRCAACTPRPSARGARLAPGPHASARRPHVHRIRPPRDRGAVTRQLGGPCRFRQAPIARIETRLKGASNADHPQRLHEPRRRRAGARRQGRGHRRRLRARRLVDDVLRRRGDGPGHRRDDAADRRAAVRPAHVAGDGRGVARARRATRSPTG